jgi:hypothetical protein
MSRFLLVLVFCFIIRAFSFGQSTKQSNVFTQDIDNFWVAFDSTRTTKDTLQQLHFMQTLYVDKGTEGLKAFMKARNYSAERWVKLINIYPKFWNSIRPNTELVKTKVSAIEKSIKKFKKLYPGLKDATMYFTIGGLRSGGTTTGNMVLIGTEIATGDSTTDVSEFVNKWLPGVFKEQSSQNIVRLNIHEFVHTQQKGESESLLAQAIQEGSCDFITELVLDEQLKTNYANYGRLHEKELKETFRQEMFTTAYNKWLYNGSSAETVADLGYFMGYQLCKSYYTNSSDKKKAIKEIIELDYSDTSAVEAFLNKSKYYPEPFSKEELVRSFREKQPVVVTLAPFSNGDSLVDASIKELTVVFSKPMATKGYSIGLGEKGNETYPINGVVGFSADKTSFTVTLNLQPNHEYEFVITNWSFNSAEGYPLLEDYRVKFRTR